MRWKTNNKHCIVSKKKTHNNPVTGTGRFYKNRKNAIKYEFLLWCTNERTYSRLNGLLGVRKRKKKTKIYYRCKHVDFYFITQNRYTLYYVIIPNNILLLYFTAADSRPSRFSTVVMYPRQPLARTGCRLHYCRAVLHSRVRCQISVRSPRPTVIGRIFSRKTFDTCKIYALCLPGKQPNRFETNYESCPYNARKKSVEIPFFLPHCLLFFSL